MQSHGTASGIGRTTQHYLNDNPGLDVKLLCPDGNDPCFQQSSSDSKEPTTCEKNRA